MTFGMCGRKFCRFFFRVILIIAFTTLIIFQSTAQNCPPNIDFETGTFNGWTCYIGTTAAVNGQNVISLSPSGGPIDNRHTMYAFNSGAGYDPFGGFPVNCPNGSGYSIRLGNSSAGTEAEGVSYDFVIPANRNEFSLIYHYAVIFQDPAHKPEEQPRFVVEITNVTDDIPIYCSSFTFFPVSVNVCHYNSWSCSRSGSGKNSLYIVCFIYSPFQLISICTYRTLDMES